MYDYKYMNHDGWYELRRQIIDHKLDEIKEHVKYIVNIPDPELSDPSMYLADCCELAIEFEYPEAVDWCLEQKQLDVNHLCHVDLSDWSKTDRDYKTSTTLVRECVVKSNVDALDKLLKLGAELSTKKGKNIDGEEVYYELVDAAVQDSDDCSKMLPYLEAHGLSYKDFLDSLVWLAYYGHKHDNIKWLIAQGASPNARDCCQMPFPMTVVCLDSNPVYRSNVKDPHEFFDWLLSNGGNPNLQSSLTPAAMTSDGGYTLIEHLLSEMHLLTGFKTLLRPDLFDNFMVILKTVCDILKKHDYDFCSYGGYLLWQEFYEGEPTDMQARQELLDKQKQDPTTIPLWVVEKVIKGNMQRFPKTAETRLKKIKAFLKGYMI